jgi:hypothetical protein
MATPSTPLVTRFRYEAMREQLRRTRDFGAGGRAERAQIRARMKQFGREKTKIRLQGRGVLSKIAGRPFCDPIEKKAA